ncbi:bifunctional histidinol-phosphatase/imidazoleglycerol-phosphate dehydratase HisB [Ancylomarina euxinus]|uniref:Histidine biosynthesis bifunctional protein HisB n=1 Tax=Ancylomarina euxinus TaxID=2283627 RepID=A0A425Y3W1_9BACT|nr:bifunctional histidinol-phosphatase/imidazoleglycerol-phosphate dehydratase HisB [Ancylomarina euxinus]MCZ4694548.1 bifunctional histidinol-phosphatase/imidazoleglycerol-phosphate dehydratase HisB [Ancylomarina euxinus]MUP14091.1 bifunctional histidinol-phosphatase/imidazoleglycerol-phosphate dehydratase HisB [Ancylomarina euxinus]RRG22949.1 bifunctional histidinol-phosphatase/imidazoleglycerol-phosphate dehydratase HisB [Ancylomarina euxinus]
MQNTSQKKKVLFIDRDGTLIIEPPLDFQVDSLEKLEFYPGVFQGLGKIASQLNFELAMVTNQDGLGTDSFPEADFWPAQNKMMQALENEGISFNEIIIDKTFPEDNAPTRKPGTALLEQYLSDEYDLENSFVIGDRWTDVELAKNLNAKAIFINAEQSESEDQNDLKKQIALRTTSWDQIFEFLRLSERTALIERNTLETQIRIELDLDGSSQGKINTGLGFFDHMLEQILKHSGINLSILTVADLNVDEHHCIEDTGIALGEAFKKALGDKLGIERYGFCLPMDDCLAQVALDFGGRNELVWEADFKREMIGDVPTEMFSHFFKSFSNGALCNLNIKAEGRNEHHKIEGIFKAFARAIRMAIKRDVNNLQVPSTKGLL